MKEWQKMTWKEWVTKVSKEMEEDPMLASPEKEVSHGLTFDWDKTEQDYVATGNINKKVH